jgi:hypothetical protein
LWNFCGAQNFPLRGGPTSCQNTLTQPKRLAARGLPAGRAPHGPTRACSGKIRRFLLPPRAHAPKTADHRHEGVNFRWRTTPEAKRNGVARCLRKFDYARTSVRGDASKHQQLDWRHAMDILTFVVQFCSIVNCILSVLNYLENRRKRKDDADEEKF